MKTLPLPSPQQIQLHLPVPLEQQEWLVESRNTISAILHGEDPRFLLIVGPCSIHDIRSAEELARALLHLQEKVEDTFYLVMRAYVEKARSSIGWKGYLYDPHLDDSSDILEGIHLSRSLLLSLARQKIPTGAELLHPLLVPYYVDLLSWGSIGARTCTSQPHRELASSLDLPIGIKNTLDGNIEAAIQGISAVNRPQAAVILDELGRVVITKTPGNAHAHLVLRGGESGPNFQGPRFTQSLESLLRANIQTGLLIDCSHGNSRKIPEKQIDVFQTIFQKKLEGIDRLRGAMLETNIVTGRQTLSHPHTLLYGQSITDGCLDWERTEKLILWAYEQTQMDRGYRRVARHPCC